MTLSAPAQFAMRGVDTGEIYYVQGRLDPSWGYWPKTEAQKREARLAFAAFFAASPFAGARRAAVRIYKEEREK